MKNLREARSEAGLTQKKLAQIVGISQQSYSDYENGRTFPDEATFVKLANALNVSTDYLLGRSDELGGVVVPSHGAASLSEEEEEFLRLFRRMDRAQRVRFQAYGEGLLGEAVPLSGKGVRT